MLLTAHIQVGDPTPTLNQVLMPDTLTNIYSHNIKDIIAACHCHHRKWVDPCQYHNQVDPLGGYSWSYPYRPPAVIHDHLNTIIINY